MLVWCWTGSQGPVWTAGGLFPCSRASWNLACYQNTGASQPSPQQTDLPRKALILCKSRTFERWILAYTGVEFKGVSSITSSISVVWECVCTSGVHWFYRPPENMTLFALQAVKGRGMGGGSQSWLLLTWVDTRSRSLQWGPQCLCSKASFVSML